MMLSSPLVSFVSGIDPSSMATTNIVTLLITSIVVPFALALMHKYGLRPPGPTPPAIEEKSSAPASYGATELTPFSSKDDILSMVPDMWKRLQDLEKREDAWQLERAEIISQNKMLMKTNAILGRSLHTFFQWVDDGSKPPSPEVSEDLKDIVRLIIERVEEDETNLKK